MSRGPLFEAAPPEILAFHPMLQTIGIETLRVLVEEQDLIMEWRDDVKEIPFRRIGARRFKKPRLNRSRFFQIPVLMIAHTKKTRGLKRHFHT